MGILISILAFIIAIAILVAFHEFGHFWVARRLGVKVQVFSIGFGKKLMSWRGKDGTEYAISAVPLGGYVKMLDEREGDVKPEELDGAFNRKPLWVRFAVVSAGPIFNFIFAIVAYWLIFMLGLKGTVPLVGEVTPGSIAAQAGITAGDQIVAIEQVPVKTWSDVFRSMMPRIGDTGYVRFDLKNDNEPNKTVNLNISNWVLEERNPDLLISLGIEAYYPPIPPIIKQVNSSDPAGAAGFQVGDFVLSVDGKKISDWQGFVDIVEVSPFVALNVIVERDGKEIPLVLTPRTRGQGPKADKGFAGLVVEIPEPDPKTQWTERFNPLDAFIASLKKTNEFIGISFKMIGKMIVGDIGLYNLSGPITIAQGAGVSFSVGFQHYLNFLALISISLGVINLLPIPILDGGHLLYYVIEFITRKPVSERVQIIGFKLGMLFLIFVMTVAFYNDLIRMFAQ